MSHITRPRIPEVIHRPDLLDAARRSTLAAIATAGWLIWLYLLMPLAAAVAWWFGYQRMDIFVLKDPARTLETLAVFSIIISLGGAAFILWAVYNWLRFRHHDRRGTPPIADNLAIAQGFAIEPDAVRLAQHEKIIDFSFDDHGQITQIKSKPLPAALPAHERTEPAVSWRYPRPRSERSRADFDANPVRLSTVAAKITLN
jgi:poly-beta-1,6-N-acetyl-D-glucosamine biosynthesis protein PgaD